jgi:hypothetical protein
VSCGQVGGSKALTSWNDRFIGSNKKQILLANELILRLDVDMETRALSTKERGFRKLLKWKFDPVWCDRIRNFVQGGVWELWLMMISAIIFKLEKD